MSIYDEILFLLSFNIKKSLKANYCITVKQNAAEV